MKKQNIFKMLATTILLVFTAAVFGNNIRVTINSYDAVTKKLNVTLAWDNSWHDGTGTFRDAAWLFVKYKDATMSEWAPAPMNNPVAAQIQATGNGIRFEILPKNLQTGGYRGWIVRRSKIATLAANDTTMTGVYNVSMTFDIPFLFSGTPVSPEFKVFGLEMVDIPKSSFYVGDGANRTNTLSTSTTVSTPKLVSNELATSVSFYNVPNSLVNVAATYPKGVDEFYIMKYELSMEGFAEYLNTLNYYKHTKLIERNAYDFSPEFNPDSVMFNYIIFQRNGTNPMTFKCDLNDNKIGNESNDGQYRPVLCDRDNAAAYLDWAGIRPMSEFEYEKASRGPAYPIRNEKIWGGDLYTTNALTQSDLLDVGGVNERLSSQINAPSLSFIIRCGANAWPTGSTRLNSAGSYYGVMDLGTNAHEIIAPVAKTYTSNPVLNPFTPNNGDGVLSSEGLSDVVGWPELHIRGRAEISERADVFSSFQGIRGVIK